MKYIGMPLGMWALFAGSFRRQLTVVFGYDAAAAKEIMKRAKPQYRKLIAMLPAFEKADRFQMNIVNCAMLGAFICSMPERPDVERLTVYYADAMMTKPMKWFCRKSGKKKFTEKDIAGMQATAALKAADRNPYSWNMEYYAYPDGSGYEARFTQCGICTLMKELGLYDLTPALCHLDYTMARRVKRRISCESIRSPPAGRTATAATGGKPDESFSFDRNIGKARCAADPEAADDRAACVPAASCGGSDPWLRHGAGIADGNSADALCLHRRERRRHGGAGLCAEISR